MGKIDLIFVEDSDVDAKLIERVIKKEALTEKYIWLKDGNEALKYFQNEDNQMPCVILLDVKLPKISGLEVVKILKGMAHTKNIPVVMYSSSGQESDIKTAYQNGANSYLIKPRNYTSMKEQFIRFYKYWKNNNLIS